MGPGGPAAPEGPDSPFSPLSPLGPWRERPASVPSEPAPVSQSAVLASGETPCLHGKASALGVGGRHAGPSGSLKLPPICRMGGLVPSPWWPPGDGLAPLAFQGGPDGPTSFLGPLEGTFGFQVGGAAGAQDTRPLPRVQVEAEARGQETPVNQPPSVPESLPQAVLERTPV